MTRGNTIRLDPVTINKMLELPWFSACGQPCRIPDVMAVKNAREALKGISSARWENTFLDYRGDFTTALCLLSIRSQEKPDRQWNPQVDAFKEKCLPALEPLWQKALEPLGLWEKPVIDDLRFCVLGIVVIDAYKEILETPEFFRRLLAVCQEGHLPCGWKGKKDKGCLLVY